MKFAVAKSSVAVLLLVTVCCLQFGESAFLNKFTSGLKNLFKKNPKSIRYVKYYNEINDYLLKNLPTDESVDANLGLVESWKAQLKQKTSFSAPSKHLLESIDQFLKLQKLNRDDQLCSPLSGQILEANDDSTSDSVVNIRQNGLEQARRIDKIVYQLAEKHIATCPARLGPIFHERYSKLPAKTRQQVEDFQEKILSVHLVDDDYHANNLNPEQPKLFIQKFPIETAVFIETQMRDYGHHIHDLSIVYETIDEGSKNERDIDNVYLHRLSTYGYADKEKVDRLFQRHLINPCIDYINWLEAAFSPLEFDFAYIEPLKVFPIIDSPENAKMLHSFVNYQACEKLIQDKDVLFKYLVKYVDWRVGQLDFVN